ncbi:hypothetical protein DV515_00019653 [Chloebia gouldiae]|uniref:LRAT domain-containing protein n=1 Tax=Chloebia gouldiae TaxID=44316 RepID=A0A3L8Q453_CHLGU|nr:hypothetical protein DV515_00019653 [Chloebia gouldiae]
MTEDKVHPNPGDLIEIKRRLYTQWALYVGDGYVIHVTAIGAVQKPSEVLGGQRSSACLPSLLFAFPIEGAPSLSASSESMHTGKARVTKELLEKLAVNDEWAVNNNYDRYRAPLPVEEIIWRAEGCIGKELPCDVLSKGSEDFVTQLRYGGEVSATG